jgi:RNA polymerase sigma-70 factor (ECF subfamily)
MTRFRSQSRGAPDGAAAKVAALACQHLDDVYRYVLYLTGDPSAAEDLTAQTFEAALRSYARFDPRRGSARAWLCQLARSAALDHLRGERRRRRREDAYAGTRPDRDEARFGEGFSPELEAALRTLSAGEREVLALRLLLDLDGPTTARVLGISHTACTTRLSRALRKLEEGMTSHAYA